MRDFENSDFVFWYFDKSALFEALLRSFDILEETNRMWNYCGIPVNANIVHTIKVNGVQCGFWTNELCGQTYSSKYQVYNNTTDLEW